MIVKPGYEEWSDEQLLGSADEDGAFEALYRRHFTGVLRFLAGRCDNADDVADAAAATWLAVLTAHRTFDPRRGRATGWLYSVAANEAKRLRRGSRRRGALAERVSGRRLLLADDIDRLNEMIDSERALAALRESLAAAPAGERELLAAIVDQDLTTADAARSLGISAGAARVRLSRLRHRVADAVAPPTDTEETHD